MRQAERVSFGELVEQQLQEDRWHTGGDQAAGRLRRRDGVDRALPGPGVLDVPLNDLGNEHKR